MNNNSSIIFEDCKMQIINKINEKERKRISLPELSLTEEEYQVLRGIADGRNNFELDNAIKLITKNDSYNALTKRLLRKFEATTIAHAMYKAVKMGIIE